MNLTPLRCTAGLAAFCALIVAGCTQNSSTPAPGTQPTVHSVQRFPSTTTSAAPGNTVTVSTLPGGTTVYSTPGQPPQIMIPNPNGDGSMVPCEGSICHNPNSGGGPDGGTSSPSSTTPVAPTDGNGPDGTPEPGQSSFSSTAPSSGQPTSQPTPGNVTPSNPYAPSQSGQSSFN